MSTTPYTLMLLVPAEHATLPPVGGDLCWTQVPDEDHAEVWLVHPASCTDAELDAWHRAELLGEDVPLVWVERMLSDQAHVPLPGHTLLRLSLSTSLRRTVRVAPHAWAFAMRVVGALHVTFAWSTSDYALDALWAGGEPPWRQVHPTLIFHEVFLGRLHLDPFSLDDIAGDGDVFRLKRFSSHWLVQAPEGLGNESAAMPDHGAVDNALLFALQRVTGGHNDAVQHWLQGAHTP